MTAVNADGAAFAVLGEIDHVLARPAMYTGFECGEHEARVFVCDLVRAEDDSVSMRVESRDARVDRVAAKPKLRRRHSNPRMKRGVNNILN